ncbi:MAG: endonuclease III domain-containing protein [Thermoplasmataceae archaeon]
MDKIHKLLDLLEKHYGDTGWWPGETRDEIVIGAILTQNTSWKNVEKALSNLKQANAITLNRLAKLNETEIAALIRPSGFYNQKAKRLKSISEAITRKYGSVDYMKGRPLDEVSAFLKEQNGIGQETLDSILNYALDFPVFVVDKYTLRIIERFGIENEGVKDLKEAVLKYYGGDVKRIKNAHGMIVFLGKDYCKTKPICSLCPLREECDFALRRNS